MSASLPSGLFRTILPVSDPATNPEVILEFWKGLGRAAPVN